MTTKAQLAAKLDGLPDDLAVASLIYVDPATQRVMSVTPNLSFSDTTRLLTSAANDPGEMWGTGTPFGTGHQPMLTATYGTVESGQGGTAIKRAVFTGILLDTIGIDTHQAYEPAVGIYTVPEDGAYDVRLKFRIADGDITGVSYGIGVGVVGRDSPAFVWATGAPKRQGAQYSETIALKRGDQLRPFYYFDGAPTTYIAADLTILRVR